MVTLVSVLIATPMAYIMSTMKIRGAGVLQILILVSSMSAPFIGAYAWIQLCGRNGIVTNLLAQIGIQLGDIYGFKGCVIVMSFQLYSLVFMFISGAFKSMDNSLIEASESLGCAGIRKVFKVVLPHDVTVIEQQTNGTLAPWAASDGETLSFVRDGIVPAAKIFADAQSANSKITWLLRLAGLLVMYFGLKMVLGPIDTLVDVIPILNGIVAMGTSLAAGLVAGACALLTIGVAWVFYRPWLGIPLIAVGVGLLVMVFVKKKKAAAATT